MEAPMASRTASSIISHTPHLPASREHGLLGTANPVPTAAASGTALSQDKSLDVTSEIEARLLADLAFILRTIRHCRQAPHILCDVRDIHRVEKLLYLIEAELDSAKRPPVGLPPTAASLVRSALPTNADERRRWALLVSDLLWDIEQSQAS